jgi:hypothetical protein
MVFILIMIAASGPFNEERIAYFGSNENQCNWVADAMNKTRETNKSPVYVCKGVKK